MKQSIEGNLLKNFDMDALTATRQILDKVRRLNNTDENEEATISETVVDDLNAFYVELKSFLGGGQVFERLDNVRDRLDDETDVMQSVATLYSSHFAAQSHVLRPRSIRVVAIETTLTTTATMLKISTRIAGGFLRKASKL